MRHQGINSAITFQKLVTTFGRFCFGAMVVTAGKQPKNCFPATCRKPRKTQNNNPNKTMESQMMTVQQYRNNRVNWTQTFTIFLAAVLGCLVAMAILMFLGRFLMKRQIEATVKELENLAPPTPSIASLQDDDNDDDDWDDDDQDDDDPDDDGFNAFSSSPGSFHVPESVLQVAEESTPPVDSSPEIKPEAVKAKATPRNTKKGTKLK